MNNRPLVRKVTSLGVWIAVLLCLVNTLFAAGVKGESTYREYDKIVLTADGVSDKAQVLWDVTGTSDVQTEEAAGKCYVWAKPGKYVVTLTAIDFEAKKVTRAKFSFKVEGDRTPKPPTPPKPPEPKPPEPPSPDPAPIPAEGFRVLIVYESADLAKIPAAQNTILYSRILRDYLDSKCVRGEKNKEWRIWDKDVDTSAESKLWQDALKRPRTSTPWIIISTGKTGYEGPLPANVEKTLELLKKHGGG